jgi:hypothetical protein
LRTYPLLGQLTGTLVLAVSEKFDDTTLIGSEAIKKSYNQYWFLHFFYLKKRTRDMYKTHPATSLTTSRTKAVRLLR